MIDKQIKELRKYLGLTQAEFGKAIGRTLSTVQNWERGSNSPPKSAILSICRIFGVNQAWLLTGEGSMLDQSGGVDNSKPSDKSYVSSFMRDDINELVKLLQEYGTPNIIKQFIKKMNDIKKLHHDD